MRSSTRNTGRRDPWWKTSRRSSLQRARKKFAPGTDAKLLRTLLAAGLLASPVADQGPDLVQRDGPPPVLPENMVGCLRQIGRRIDAVIERTVPGVSKAVKWNSPFYGIEGEGWFLSLHCFTKYIKVAFFRGLSLQPLPPDPIIRRQRKLPNSPAENRLKS